MNNLRDPFSIRAKPALPFQLLRQQTITQTIATITSEAQRAATHIQPAVESAVIAVSDTVSAVSESVSAAADSAADAAMSFNMPKNVPSFTSSQRDLEDKVWAAAFGQKKDLPMYKDKPYYTRSQGINSRRRMMRRKRVFFGLGVLLALAWWVGLFSGGMGGKRSGEVDWEERRQEVKKVMQESWKAYETDAWGTKTLLQIED